MVMDNFMTSTGKYYVSILAAYEKEIMQIEVELLN